jgi:hypothetical protein
MKYKRTFALGRSLLDGADIGFGQFELAISHYEKQSAKGWQLEKPGIFWNRFVRDSSANYMYAFTKIEDELFTYYNAGNEWSFVTTFGLNFIYRKTVPQDLVRLEKLFEKNEIMQEQDWILQQAENGLFLCRCEDHVYTFSKDKVSGTVKYLVDGHDDLSDFDLYLKEKKDQGWHFIGKDQNRFYFDDDFSGRRKELVSLSNADLNKIYKHFFLVSIYVLFFLLIVFGILFYILRRENLKEPESILISATLFWMAVFVVQIVILIYRYKTFNIESKIQKRRSRI